MLFAIVFVFVLFTLISRRYPSLYRWLGFLSLTGHIFVAVVLIPRLPYDWDISAFHSATLDILSGNTLHASTTVSSFAGFQAIVYTTFGADPINLAVVNSVLAVFIPIPVAYLAKQLYPSTLQSTDGLFALVLFLPILFLFTTIPMRDALSILVFFSSLAFLVASLAEDRPLAGILALPLCVVLYLLRPELVCITVLSTGAAFIVRALDQITVGKVELSSLVGLVLIPSITVALVVAPQIPLKPLNRRIQFRASGDAAYLEGMTYGSEYDVLLVAPTRAIYFQFAPFPLHVNAVFDLVAVSMLPVLLLLVISAYRSLMEVDVAKPVVVLLVLVYLSGVVGYGLVDSNFGTTARHRIPFTLLLVVFASPTIQKWELSVRERFGESPN